MPPVWARKRISLTTCPKAYVTAESMQMVEEFLVRKRLGCRMDPQNLSARQVDAFLVLEGIVAAELRDGEQNTRQTV